MSIEGYQHTFCVLVHEEEDPRFHRFTFMSQVGALAFGVVCTHRYNKGQGLTASAFKLWISQRECCML